MVMVEDLIVRPRFEVGDEHDRQHHTGDESTGERHDPSGSSGGKTVVLKTALVFGEKSLL
jgi:hypothetical protein